MSLIWRRFVLVALAVIGVIPGTGCGSDTEPAAVGDRSEEGQDVLRVNARDFGFDPSEIVVDPGEEITVELVNVGGAVHDFTVDDLGVFVEAQPGQVAVAVFTAPTSPGTVTFYCAVPGHRAQGMEGRLRIRG